MLCSILFYDRSNMTVAFADRVCSYYSFRCQNGQCISFHLWCDGQYDCDDGSDETNCGKDVINFSIYCNVH